MSSKFEELSKLMDLYNSGVINEAEMNKLKAQLLEIEPKEEETPILKENITSTPEENNNLNLEEIIIETPEELFESADKEKDIKPNEKSISTDDTTKKLNALLQAGKISEKEYHVLIDKILHPQKQSVRTPKVASTPAEKTKLETIQTSEANNPKDIKKVKLVADKKEKIETEIKPVSVPKENVLSNSTSRKKNGKKIILALVFVIIVAGAVLSYFFLDLSSFTSDESETASEPAIPTVSMYVMSGSLKLLKEPNESSDQIFEYPFGSEIIFIEGTEKEVDGVTYMQAMHEKSKGWVSIKVSGVDLISSKDNIDKIQTVVTGDYAQETLESIGASGKYAILNICDDSDKISAADSDWPPVVLFRSRIGNRNSSSDKKKGINDDPKDMIFCVNKSNGQQWIYLVYFDKDYNYNVAFKSKVEYGHILGFERLSRHTSIDFEYQGYYYYDYYLEHDLVKVHYKVGNPRYYNPSSSYYDWYNIAY